MTNKELEELMDEATRGLEEKTELGEVAKEFNTFTPSSSNLGKDEHTLLWRGKNILKRMSPSSVSILDDFMNTKRSVGGWNTHQKVSAITGIQQQRQGGGMKEKLFGNRRE